MHRLHDARGANAAPVREAMRHHSRPFNRQHREDAAPVTRHCTRYRALHPLRGTAPDQNGCNAYGSGALHTQTRTNAESAGTSNNTQHNTNDTTPGAAPVTRRYTRYGAQHPIRTGAMPTDRVHCTRRQEQTRNLKAHTTHGTGELARRVRQPPAHQAPPATTEHRPAHSPTWRQRGPTPAHVKPPGDNIGAPAQPPVNGGSCAQVG